MQRYTLVFDMGNDDSPHWPQHQPIPLSQPWPSYAFTQGSTCATPAVNVPHYHPSGTSTQMHASVKEAARKCLAPTTESAYLRSDSGTAQSSVSKGGNKTPRLLPRHREGEDALPIIIISQHDNDVKWLNTQLKRCGIGLRDHRQITSNASFPNGSVGKTRPGSWYRSVYPHIRKGYRTQDRQLGYSTNPK